MQTKIHTYKSGHLKGKTISYIVDGDGKVVAKECNKCDKMLELTKFSPVKTGLHGCDSKCKECKRNYENAKYASDEKFRERRLKGFSQKWANDEEWREERSKEHKERYENNKTDYWTIYLIDNFDGKGNHYVGQTQNLPYRLAVHRNRGADISYVLEMDRAPTQKLADEYEAEYHKRGYCGARGCEVYKAMMERHKKKKQKK